MTDTVTIPRTCLETLLRRAELHDSDASIKIPITHYKFLIQDVQQFRYLKAALITGGATEETLNILINSQSSQTPPLDCNFKDDISTCTSQWDDSGSLFLLKAQRSALAKHNRNANDNLASVLPTDSTTPLTPTSMYHSGDGTDTSVAGAPLDESVYGDRSVVIEGVSHSTSLLDLTRVIRGGMISNLYIRRRERSAHLSFVDPEAASNFIAYSHQNNVVIKGKSVRIRWDDYQAHIPDHIMNRIIHHGASRNIVIRSPKAGMTAESIKDDLAHIHQLEVVDLSFEGGHAWIKLNSIRHAVTAKNCMLSRLLYKNLRIEFFADECNVPLASARLASKRRQTSDLMLKPAVVPLTNRFQALSTHILENGLEQEV